MDLFGFYVFADVPCRQAIFILLFTVVVTDRVSTIEVCFCCTEYKPLSKERKEEKIGQDGEVEGPRTMPRNDDLAP